MIEEYFGDGSRFGVTIEYVQEEQRMGTAGALSLMREKLQSDFFVMNGDLLTNVNFEHLLNFHRNNQAAATMCVRQYDFQVPYGVVELEGEQIRSIVEKPVHNFFVSAGIYVLNPETLQQIPDGQFYDMPTLFDVMIAKGERCVSFPIHEYWLDIGRMSDYQQANDEYDEIFQ
jgi:NDP-sugar pyrophosphorylase family protein